MSTYAAPLPEDITSYLTGQQLNAMAQNHQVQLNLQDNVAIGTADQLANFFQELDGPAQSFPITPFLEWLQGFKLAQ